MHTAEMLAGTSPRAMADVEGAMVQNGGGDGAGRRTCCVSAGGVTAAAAAQRCLHPKSSPGTLRGGSKLLS